MQRNSLYAALLAAACAFPLAAGAGGTQGDKTASANGSNDGGAEQMFQSMDKDGDGFLSKLETRGTPHDAAFDRLDADRDGKLTRAEHAAAPEHVAARAGAVPTGKPESASPDTAGETKKY